MPVLIWPRFGYESTRRGDCIQAGTTAIFVGMPNVMPVRRVRGSLVRLLCIHAGEIVVTTSGAGCEATCDSINGAFGPNTPDSGGNMNGGSWLAVGARAAAEISRPTAVYTDVADRGLAPGRFVTSGET